MQSLSVNSLQLVVCSFGCLNSTPLCFAVDFTDLMISSILLCFYSRTDLFGKNFYNEDSSLRATQHPKPSNFQPSNLPIYFSTLNQSTSAKPESLVCCSLMQKSPTLAPIHLPGSAWKISPTLMKLLPSKL